MDKETEKKIESLEKEIKELKRSKRRHNWWLAYLLWNK
jgi:hypothetical protein